MKKSLLLLLFFIESIFIWTITAEEVMEEIDNNLYSRSQISQARMIIHNRRGSREIVIKSWTEGRERSFSEYLSPPREKGTKMLKIKKQLWIYHPDTDRIIKIAGHMLRQSVSGSDLSYEDFLESTSLKTDYSAELEENEIINEIDCYVLNLFAKDETIAYQKRKLWIDKNKFVPVKQELFGKSGKLLKKIEMFDFKKHDNRWYPQKMVFKDMLKKGDGTEILTDFIEFDEKIPESVFSKSSLRK